MKTVILCGGRGVRFAEMTNEIPKPMIKIGSLPLLMHIMNIYSQFDFRNFILCLGYKQEVIRDYFLDYYLHNSDIIINLKTGFHSYTKQTLKDYVVHLLDTGENTLTGSRLLKVRNFIDDDYFLMTYGDGLSNVDISKLIEFHKSHGKLATLTAVKKQGKFGTIKVEDNVITSFKEKPIEDDFINGGFFCFSKKVLDYIAEGDLPDSLEVLAKNEQLMAFKHDGFWDCVDTLNDKMRLDKYAENETLPWMLKIGE